MAPEGLHSGGRSCVPTVQVGHNSLLLHLARVWPVCCGFQLGDGVFLTLGTLGGAEHPLVLLIKRGTQGSDEISTGTSPEGVCGL